MFVYVREIDVWMLVKSNVSKRVNSGKRELGDLFQQSFCEMEFEFDWILCYNNR